MFEQNKKNQLALDSLKFFKDQNKVLNYIEKNRIICFEINALSIDKPIIKLIEVIKKYLIGEKINLYEEIAYLNLKLEIKSKFNSEFSQKVILWILNNLKYGQVMSYCEIGKKINSKAYRAIGNILKNNPFPLIIPCHRVIRNNGEIGGFMGKNDKSWEQNIKKKLLTLEGLEL
ncbi:MAG: MGMT family protein [Candidatus Lokiarchaeota archaeon]|nr:MGMT family protein [Candidatus Lokiarchaeota archaeon]